MIMSPRDDDPPLSDPIVPNKKHAGTCRVPSKHCEKIAVHRYEEIMRYEVVAGQDQPNMRSASLPEEPSLCISARAKRNPMNHEGWEEPPRRPLTRPSPHKTPNATMAQLTNQIEIAQQADDERSQRFTTDMNFADLCSQVSEKKNIQTGTV